MVILIKGTDTKILSESSKLIDTLLRQGWKQKTEEKEVKNVKFSKSGSESRLSLGSE